MSAAQQRAAPLPATAASDTTAPRPSRRGVDAIDQDLALRLRRRPPRDQVDDAAHRAGAVQRRRHALDHFDLPEIHRRNLQQAEAADLLAEERQAVREEPRVAAAHALDAHARRAERRRRRLHAHAAHLVQHHDDVAGRHEHLLFDLFALEHLDAHRLILQPLVGAGGRHGDLFLVCWLWIERHDDPLIAGGGKRNVLRYGEIAGMAHLDSDGADGDGRQHHAFRVG